MLLRILPLFCFTIAPLLLLTVFLADLFARKRKGTPDAVDGEHIYRVGEGIGYIKDNLPTRVKLV
jgi:hypothetical protein